MVKVRGLEMKWTVLGSILFSAANFVTALSFLAVSSYNLSSTENRYPVPAVDTWRGYLLHVIPLSAAIMVMAILSCWGVTKPRNAPIAAFLVILHIAALAACIVYCRLVACEIEHANYHHMEIKNRTLKEFEANRESKFYQKKWVPEWLDSVQKESKSCCGVIGFEDWREFWPNSPEVPFSCCRKEHQHCITDIDQIDWPEKPTDYIKNDEGCASEIVEAAIKRIKETLKFLIVLIILIIFALFGLGFQYAREFYFDLLAEGKANRLPSNCLSTFCSRFMKQQKKPDPCVGDGPNNPAVDVLNLDLQPEIGTYSYTFLEQLKQQQSVSANDPASQVDVNSSSTQGSRAIGANNYASATSNDPGYLFSIAAVTGPSQRGPPAKSAPPPQPNTYAYEVVTAGKANYMPTNRLQQGGSAQSLPDDPPTVVEDADQAGQNIIFQDETEKQNLKQLLRFGRRHRRHRKGDMDGN